MDRLIVNADSFGGVFTHKGERCARIDDAWSGTRWIPVQGREVVVARQRHCSQGYVPAECLPEAFLATLPEWAVWRGQTSARLFVWKTDLPVDGIRLVRDWTTYVCDGPSINRFVVPAGPVIIHGESGCPAQAGYHWEI
jgi:hypothetical protein